jgi:rare lipoprotein A
MTELAPYRARGLATWYGRRYHGKPTASGEPYDMYAMTAAHTILPIPSYARVTNLKTGRAVVVRINDRGPFVNGRLIDVSYAAAHKLGILAGATMVEVETIIPGSGPEAVVARPASQPPVPKAATASVAPPPDREAPSAGTTPGTVVATPLPETERQPARPDPVPEARSPAVPPAIVAAAPAAPPAAEAGAGRVFLQLGAFGSRENAEGFLARLKSQADWLTLQVFSRDGLHRVQAGPYPNQADARQAAERVAQALGIRGIVSVR